jgi:mRNA deadenylase 3'-5' endonuclease subunit Ccr4
MTGVLQALTLLKQLEQFILSRDVALVLCGDFNSEPSSAVYEYLFEGGLTQQHPELIVSDNSVNVLPDLHSINHNVDLDSVMFSALGVEPEFTNFTAKFKGTLDYIWYSPSRLRVMGVAQIPTLSDFEAGVGVGLPCVNYPSDHIMICADLAFNITGAGILTKQQKRGGGKGMMHQQSQAGQQQGLGGMGSMGRGGMSGKSLRNAF